MKDALYSLVIVAVGIGDRRHRVRPLRADSRGARIGDC